MPTPAQTADARKIAQWNTAHGSIFGRIGAAFDALTTAIDAVETNPTDETVAALQAAAAAFAAVAEDGLRGPWSGAAPYDNPRREGLENYLRGATKLTQFDPRTNEDEGFDGGILITRGTEITGAAREYADELVRAHS